MKKKCLFGDLYVCKQFKRLRINNNNNNNNDKILKLIMQSWQSHKKMQFHIYIYTNFHKS